MASSDVGRRLRGGQLGVIVPVLPAMALGVVRESEFWRRRIYNIVNVLESIGVELIAPAVMGTLNVLKACSETKVKRVVVVSSGVAVVRSLTWPKDKVMDENCWTDIEYCRTLEYFDAAVGNISIVTNRTRIFDFTQPYEATLVIVARTKQKSSSAWSFLKPFTVQMWCVTGASIFLSEQLNGYLNIR